MDIVTILELTFLGFENYLMSPSDLGKMEENVSDWLKLTLIRQLHFAFQGRSIYLYLITRNMVLNSSTYKTENHRPDESCNAEEWASIQDT